MSRWPDTPKKRTRIEIIPMIDVMMFLLVFFVLVSINVIPALGLKTKLPQSSQAKDESPLARWLLCPYQLALLQFLAADPAVCNRIRAYFVRSDAIDSSRAARVKITVNTRGNAAQVPPLRLPSSFHSVDPG